jgi:hypothetical protein
MEELLLLFIYRLGGVFSILQHQSKEAKRVSFVVFKNNYHASKL